MPGVMVNTGLVSYGQKTFNPMDKKCWVISNFGITVKLKNKITFTILWCKLQKE
jgi:hypothetical protein